MRGAVERLPAEMYLRDSPLAHANGALRDFAAEATAGAADPLDAMHRLMSDAAQIDEPSSPHKADDPETAVEAFALRRGRARDFAHIFIACARFLGIPARFIGGYRAVDEDGEAGRASPGLRLTRRASAGSPSTRQPASAPTSATCASPSASTPATAPSSAAPTGRARTTVETAIRVEQAGLQTQA